MLMKVALLRGEHLFRSSWDDCFVLKQCLWRENGLLNTETGYKYIDHWYYEDYYQDDVIQNDGGILIFSTIDI